MDPLSWLGARLQEPSTYAGLGLLVNGAVDFMSHGLPTNPMGWIQLVGTVAGGAIAAAHKDPGSK